MFRPLLVLLFLFFFQSITFASSKDSEGEKEVEQSLRVGLYLMTSDPAYVHTKRKIYPIPYVAGSYSQFYAEGTEAGYVFNPGGTLRLKFFIKVDTQSLDSEDSSELNGIRDRGFLAFAGIKAGFDFYPFAIDIGLAQEILFRARGQRAKVKVSAPIDIDGKSFELIPFFLYVWDSQLLTKYHYGVTANEAASSNFAQYQPKDSFTPHLGFWFMVNDLKPWTIGTSYSVAFLPDTIKNSPIVEKKSIGSFVFFASYSF